MADNFNILDFAPASVASAARKNVLINADFRINQRVYVSGTNTTGADEYTLDRWRVVTSGQNVTFSALGTDNTITCPAGGYATEVEALDVIGGTYTVSWTGTATCTVGGTARITGESFTVTANTNLIVAFSGGTLKQPQLELGSTETDFEQRAIELELSMCQRYYEKSYDIGTALGTATSNGAISERSHGSAHRHYQKFEAKRATPTITIYNPNSGATGSWRDIAAGANRTATLNNIGESGARLEAGATVDGNVIECHYTADAEL